MGWRKVTRDPRLAGLPAGNFTRSSHLHSQRTRRNADHQASFIYLTPLPPPSSSPTHIPPAMALPRRAVSSLGLGARTCEAALRPSLLSQQVARQCKPASRRNIHDAATAWATSLLRRHSSLTTLPACPRTTHLQRRLFSASSSSSSSRPSPSTPPRTLPTLPNYRLRYLLIGGGAILTWTLFTMYATNAERATSTVFRAALYTVQTDPRTVELLGEPIQPEGTLLARTFGYVGSLLSSMSAGGKDEVLGGGKGGRYGAPGTGRGGDGVWVSGSINMMKGRVDVRFRVKGSKGEYRRRGHPPP